MADDLELAQGVALASFSVTVNLLTALKERGSLSEEDVSALLSSSLLVLEKDDRLTDGSVHAARVMLASIAEAHGVSLRKPS